MLCTPFYPMVLLIRQSLWKMVISLGRLTLFSDKPMLIVFMKPKIHWLVVWNIFIFHFIHGMSSGTHWRNHIFFKMVLKKTTTRKNLYVSCVFFFFMCLLHLCEATVCQMFHGPCATVLPSMFVFGRRPGAESKSHGHGRDLLLQTGGGHMFLWCIFSGWFRHLVKHHGTFGSPRFFWLFDVVRYVARSIFWFLAESFWMNQGAGISTKNTTGHGGTKLWVKRCLLHIIGHIYILYI